MVKLLTPKFPTYRHGWVIKRKVVRRGPPIAEWPIFKGDVVQVLKGRDEGKLALVKFCIPQWKKVVLDGANIVRRHLPRNSKDQAHGIVNIMSYTRFEDVALIDPTTRQPCTPVFTNIKDPATGKMIRIRVSKETGAVLEKAPVAPVVYVDGERDTSAIEASKVTLEETSNKKRPIPSNCFI